MVVDPIGVNDGVDVRLGFWVILRKFGGAVLIHDSIGDARVTFGLDIIQVAQIPANNGCEWSLRHSEIL